MIVEDTESVARIADDADHRHIELVEGPEPRGGRDEVGGGDQDAIPVDGRDILR